jgi:hypothetical protein
MFNNNIKYASVIFFTVNKAYFYSIDCVLTTLICLTHLCIKLFKNTYTYEAICYFSFIGILVRDKRGISKHMISKPHQFRES